MTLQVDSNHRIPLIFGHVEQHPFPEDASDGHDAVDTAPGVHGGTDYAAATIHRGDVVRYGDGFAAGGHDLCDHAIGNR